MLLYKLSQVLPNSSLLLVYLGQNTQSQISKKSAMGQIQHDCKRWIKFKKFKVWFGFHETKPLGIGASCLGGLDLEITRTRIIAFNIIFCCWFQAKSGRAEVLNYFNEKIQQFHSLEIDLFVVYILYSIFVSLNTVAYLQISVAWQTYWSFLINENIVLVLLLLLPQQPQKHNFC